MWSPFYPVDVWTDRKETICSDLSKGYLGRSSDSCLQFPSPGLLSHVFRPELIYPFHADALKLPLWLSPINRQDPRDFLRGLRFERYVLLCCSGIYLCRAAFGAGLRLAFLCLLHLAGIFPNLSLDERESQRLCDRDPMMSIFHIVSFAHLVHQNGGPTVALKCQVYIYPAVA